MANIVYTLDDIKPETFEIQIGEQSIVIPLMVYREFEALTNNPLIKSGVAKLESNDVFLEYFSKYTDFDFKSLPVKLMKEILDAFISAQMDIQKDSSKKK